MRKGNTNRYEYISKAEDELSENITNIKHFSS